MERRFLVTVDGQTYTVGVVDLDEAADAHSLGLPPRSPPSLQSAQPRSMPAPAAAPAKPVASPANSPGGETSPMAGVVISIEVSIGQQVQVGQRLLTLEAMKMRTPVVAHRDGTVKAIHVAAGEAVQAGQQLLSIE